MPRARKRDIQELADKYSPNFIIGVPSKPNVPSLWVKWVSPETKQDIVDRMYKSETSDIALHNKYELCLMSEVVSICINDGYFSKDDDIWLYEPNRKSLIGQFHPDIQYPDTSFQGRYNIKLAMPFFGTSPSEQQRYKEACSMQEFFAECVENDQVLLCVEGNAYDIYEEDKKIYDKLIKEINRERRRAIDLYVDGRISIKEFKERFDKLNEMEGSLVEPTLPEQDVDI